jgi:hypothetical protein
MNLTLIISMVHLAVGSICPDTSSSIETIGSKPKITVAPNKDILYTPEPQKNEFAGTTITITVSYAAIECGCPQWFETKFKNVQFLEHVERFYLEPVSKDLINANDLWDGEHLPLTVKITGRFSKEKTSPKTYHTKGIPENARIFWYDKITVVSASFKKSATK